MTTDSTMYILGTGTPTPAPDRFGSSYAVRVNGRVLLFDCGPAATHKLVKAGLWPTDVSDLFFTHHHFDHNADYGCFVMTRWDQTVDYANRLQVHGPAYTEELTRRLFGDSGAFQPDWRARIDHPGSQRVHVQRGGSLPRIPPPAVLDARDYDPGHIAEGDGWSVTAATADHAQPWLDSLAYRLDLDGYSVVFTGDTGPCDSVMELARGADLLLCMCWSLGDEPDECHAGTCSALEAAELARKAEVRQLMLVHAGSGLSARADEVTAQAAETFGGPVHFARELDTLELLQT